MIIPHGIHIEGLKYHLIVISIYVLVCIYFFFFRNSPSDFFTFHKRDLIWFAGITVLSFFTLLLVNNILSYGRLGLNTASWITIILTIGYSILFAVPEEIMFRGFFAKSLQPHVHGVFWAVVLSSLIFGFAHILNGAHALWPPTLWDWKLVGMTGVAGIFLGTLYFATGSLLFPIVLHALFIIVNQVFLKG